MSWTIRAARREDAAAIWGFVAKLAEYEKLSDCLTGSPELVEKWVFDEPVAKVLVAESSGITVGYALYFPILATFRMKPGIWLEDLYVLEESRGNGLGKALITAIFEEAKEKGYARVDWTVLDWNDSAIGFYKSLGAEILPDWRICRYSL